jgi:hypothetical protein
VNLSPSYHPGSGGDDRRRLPRIALLQEVLVLDGLTDRVADVLVGSDLSSQAIRVEPHPSLALGDRLRLAFLEDGYPDPVKLSVEAVRDDGSLGWLLRFVELTSESELRIQRIMRRLPALESFGSPPEEESNGISFARIQPKAVLA